MAHSKHSIHLYFLSFLPQNMFYCQCKFLKDLWKLPKGALLCLSRVFLRCSCVILCHSHAHTHVLCTKDMKQSTCMRQTCSNGRVCFGTRGWKGRAIRLDDQVWDHCPKHTGAPGCLQALARWPSICEAFLKGITYSFILKKDKASLNSGSSLNGCMLLGASPKSVLCNLYTQFHSDLTMTSLG